MQDLLPDLFDNYPNDLTLLSAPWRTYGAKPLFYGEIVTVKCFEDNSMVKSELAKKGHGKVLVVDGGGSTRRALLGDMIALNAVENGWEGIIIYGCVRDAGTISTLDIGVQALGTNPIKTDKKGLGEVNVSIEIAGVSLTPGMMIYADLNGIAVSQKALDMSVLL
ncbi:MULTISPECIES: putative 4-hydroxy-4-methyl-2-oxoglutarate aldolase [Shewanella]|jgi:regulator of ribonuclease activity A|uniref:putative 4-hydroxy-4-methyl-2-oxoglutarate aldolase n=1 Tax=Shewanella TaxID=22 RepID=UPI00200EFE44|nr:putative 4-hydroxy-4-methyl-2-oxoglutarate aldolase [Shewanella basaltis]MCL1114749.1 putative 4-hydroxy-4-methyl-2-oxoglutarate aldolase [Shewanella basaltis]